MLGLYKDPGLTIPLSISGMTNPDLTHGLTDLGYVSQEPLYVANKDGANAVAAGQISSLIVTTGVSIEYALDGNDMPGSYSSTLVLPPLGVYGSGSHIIKIWRKVTVTPDENVVYTTNRHILKTSSGDASPVYVETKQTLWSCALFNGVDLGGLGCTLSHETQVETLPGEEVRTVRPLGRHGTIITGTRKIVRKIELVMTLEASTYFNLLTLEDTIAGLFNPIYGYRDLVLEWDPLSTYQVKYSGQSKVTDWIQDGRVDISLKTQDPYIYSDMKYKAGAGQVRNNGSHPTPIVITVVGPALNPAITVAGKTLSYNGNIQSGQSLVIDGVNQLITLGGINVLSLLDGDIPELPSGLSNLSCSAGMIYLQWKERRLLC